MSIKTVTVIGANGTMGCNVSGIFASFGNARVYMVSRSTDKSREAAEKAAKSVKAGSIIKNLIPTDYSMLDQCIKKSDLIFESVAEDNDLKLDITRQISNHIQKDTIVCTGTSGLSITNLAEVFPDYLRSHYFGMHFFNPPYNMTLCEVTPTKYTDLKIFNEIKIYLANVLFRTVVEVKDSAAFLGNRIGFQFINQAMQYAEQYKYSGGIDYIDAILGPYTGRSMAPLATSDFVGLDVHKAIVDNIYTNTDDYAHDTFALPVFAQNLINEGKLGRKTKAGLFKLVLNEDGTKRVNVHDILSGTYRDKISYSFPFAEKMLDGLKTGDYRAAFESLINDNSIETQICLEFLLKYVIYSLSAAKDVGYNIHDADDVMATGFNWCPPLALVSAISAVKDFKSLVRERVNNNNDTPDIDSLLSNIEPSRYDYRPYFKSVK